MKILTLRIQACQHGGEKNDKSSSHILDSGLKFWSECARFDLTVCSSNNEDAVDLATCKSSVTEAGYQPDSKRQPHSTSEIASKLGVL